MFIYNPGQPEEFLAPSPLVSADFTNGPNLFIPSTEGTTALLETTLYLFWTSIIQDNIISEGNEYMELAWRGTRCHISSSLLRSKFLSEFKSVRNKAVFPSPQTCACCDTRSRCLYREGKA